MAIAFLCWISTTRRLPRVEQVLAGIVPWRVTSGITTAGYSEPCDLWIVVASGGT